MEPPSCSIYMYFVWPSFHNQSAIANSYWLMLSSRGSGRRLAIAQNWESDHHLPFSDGYNSILPHQMVLTRKCHVFTPETNCTTSKKTSKVLNRWIGLDKPQSHDPWLVINFPHQNCPKVEMCFMFSTIPCMVSTSTPPTKITARGSEGLPAPRAPRAPRVLALALHLHRKLHLWEHTRWGRQTNS